MGKGLLFLTGAFSLFNNYLVAQVEIYKGNPDTATYIAPEDTITRAPMFGDNPDEFYRYLENRYNLTLAGQYLNYSPENIRFSFYVERNGSLSDFKILYTADQKLGAEIERIIDNMPKWTPGRDIGRKKRTLMIYDINIQMVDDFPNVLITKNGLQTEFSNRYKNLKWFLIGGSVMIMFTLWITSGK